MMPPRIWRDSFREPGLGPAPHCEHNVAPKYSGMFRLRVFWGGPAGGTLGRCIPSITAVSGVVVA